MESSEESCASLSPVRISLRLAGVVLPPPPLQLPPRNEHNANDTPPPPPADDGDTELPPPPPLDEIEPKLPPKYMSSPELEPGQLPALDISVIYGFDSEKSSSSESNSDDYSTKGKRGKARGRPRKRRKVTVAPPSKGDDEPVKPERPEVSVPFEVKLEALATYRRLYGSCHVQASFVVPPIEEWPPHLHGLELGYIVSTMRASAAILKQRALLDALGFVWVLRRSDMRCIVVTPSLVGRREVAASRPWAVVLGALRQYHALYKSFAIPTDFVVPKFDRPWLKVHAGIALAHVLPALAVHVYELPDDDVADADALGLLTHVPSWTQLLGHFRLYKRLFGHCDIPLDFVVPADDDWAETAHGVGLGELAWKVGVRFSLLEQSRKKEVVRIGVAFNTPTTWAHILDELAAFAATSGDTEVPVNHAGGLRHWYERLLEADQLQMLPAVTHKAWQALRAATAARSGPVQGTSTGAISAKAPYVVPPPAEPSSAVAPLAPQPSPRCLRGWTAATDDDVVFDNPIEWAARLAALLEYAAIHGNLLVPANFVVPDEAPWPRELWRYPIGAQATALRLRRPGLAPDRRTALDDAAFVWDPWAADMLPTITSALRAIGDAPLPETTPLPTLPDDPAGYFWTLLEAHDGFTSTEARAEVAACGFDAAGRWAAKLAALDTYDLLYQHLHVPLAFVVPGEAPWPPATHGLPLGHAVAWIRRMEAMIVPARRAELAAKHFEWTAVDFTQVDAALAQYKLLVDTDAAVPGDFTIPSHEPWPAELWRLPLGVYLGKRDVYMRRMAAVQALPLASLGLGLVSPRAGLGAGYNWHMVAMALQQFVHVHGHNDVPLLYCVTSVTGRWVRSMLGMPLGFFARICRDKFTALSQHVQRSLISIGFAPAVDIKLPPAFESAESPSDDDHGAGSDASSPEPSRGGSEDEPETPTPVAIQHNGQIARAPPPSVKLKTYPKTVLPRRRAAPTFAVQALKRLTSAPASTVTMVVPPHRRPTPVVVSSPRVMKPSPLRAQVSSSASSSASSSSDEVESDDESKVRSDAQEDSRPTNDAQVDAGGGYDSQSDAGLSYDVQSDGDDPAASTRAAPAPGRDLAAAPSQRTGPSGLLSPLALLRACEVYFRLHRDISIPASFVVPARDPRWPSAMWSVPLGAHWHAALDDTSVPDVSTADDEAVLAGLRAYESRTGHRHVAPTFQIPHGELTWPQKTWGLQLGAARDRPPTCPPVDWEKLVRGLQTFKSVYDNVDVSPEFSVPSGQWEWPEEVWQYPLGVVVQAIRSGRVFMPPSAVEHLTLLTFRWTTDDEPASNADRLP
ncbi:hypothetical protein ACHHYP_14948 [Achlya hypogyna]|uniref:Helicase-associated domain-containing protein n=1 Tax=Achlya hypogyna TaxID=1202772 RepID=A0A1V9YBV8_ACHHY|nr:hypothetical protein ACHHYP_14948 [Achlya hypogyna]